jgi:hypothetical protein
MFVLRRGSGAKYCLLFAFLGLHLISVATLNIPYANIACAATVVLMFREELMSWLRGGYVEPVGAKRFGLSGAVALFMVAMLTLAMVSSVSLINWRAAPREMKSGDVISHDASRPQLIDGRADGLDSVQITFFGALWAIGIAQQYQLFNWIDYRNYATHYRVVSNGADTDPDAMFVRSLRGVLLDFYIHDITWLRIPPERRAELRSSILARTAARYCRNERPAGDVEAYSSLERIDPKGGPGEFDNVLLMRFSCQDGGMPVFAIGP